MTTCYIVISNGYGRDLHSSITRAKRSAAGWRAQWVREGFGRSMANAGVSIETRTVRDMATHVCIPGSKAWSIKL